MKVILKQTKIILTFIIFGISIISYLKIEQNYTSNLEKMNPDQKDMLNSVPQSAIDHSPIFINGNTELDIFCGGNGTNSINGTNENPYIIQNLNIAGNTTHSGIQINYVTLYTIIQNCTVQYNGVDWNPAGIKIQNCENMIIRNNSVLNNIYCGIELQTCNNLLLENNSIRYNGCGISIKQTTNFTIQRNFISNSGNDGIEITSACSSFLIHYNELNNNTHNGINLLENSNNGKIIHNFGRFNGQAGILIGSNDNDISFNSFNYSSYGIRLYGLNAYNNLVTNNSLYSNSEGILIDTNANQIVLLNNNLHYNIKSGIALRFVYNISIEKNIIQFNENGIFIINSLNFTIQMNYIANSNYDGICVSNNSQDFSVINNELYSNKNTGISITQKSSNGKIEKNIGKSNDHADISIESNNNEISFNNISNSIHSGIELSSINAYNNLVFNNTITVVNWGININNLAHDNIIFMNDVNNNNIGIELQNTNYGHNTIYLNKIYLNKNSAFCTNATMNYWDNGSVGNYWGDYLDFYPRAKVNNGIYSIPYGIGGTNDRYPLEGISHLYLNNSTTNSNPFNMSIGQISGYPIISIVIIMLGLISLDYRKFRKIYIK